MPRRNARQEHDPEPLTIVSVADLNIPRVRRRSWMSDEEWQAERDERDRLHRERKKVIEAAARRARVQAAIKDWDICLVPGCEGRAAFSPGERDVDTSLPVCDYHVTVIKEQVRTLWATDAFDEHRSDVAKHKRQLVEANARSWEISENGGHSKGQIYFLRANGLVKVGWSGTLTRRLKSYGPDVEILCHYPASRQDETLMHRQLRPYLAKGREWYQDCKLIEDVVAGIIKRHGPPQLSASWTQPKEPTIKPHKRAS